MGVLSRLIFLLILTTTTFPQTSALGRFEMRLPEATDLLSPRILKLCLKQFETFIRVDDRCFLGTAEAPLQNTTDIQIPFSFGWKENYSLIVQISESDRVIDQLVKSDTLRPGEEWRDAATENGTVRFQYRLLCEPNFYGKDCLRKCFPTKTTFCAEDGTRKCLEGWTGRFCREPICEEGCVHGRCQQPGKCLCASGYKGPRCDQCIPMQGCVHGSCSAPFGCDCEPGWGGMNCNTTSSLCDRMKPCLNGGQCQPLGQHSFICQCPPGFTGPTCATPLSPCAGEANPCANGATCQPVGAFDFLCRCPEGWTGRFCREPICEEGCVHGQCQQPGKCLCASGYEGPRCDQCIPMEGCVHGSCSTPFGCDCEPGWEGTNCNTSTPLCDRMKPCLNGGQCHPFGEHSFVCQCPPGFTGATCAIALSPCAGEANPCANGATCQHIGVFDFLCRCAKGWTGRFCDRLDSRQCQNGGVRTEEGSCLCPSGFEGTSCELAVLTNSGESNQLQRISITLSLVVVLVLVILVLIVFSFPKNEKEDRGVVYSTKFKKVSITTDNVYGSDPSDRTATKRLLEAEAKFTAKAASKAPSDEHIYVDIDQDPKDGDQQFLEGEQPLKSLLSL